MELGKEYKIFSFLSSFKSEHDLVELKAEDWNQMDAMVSGKICNS